MTAPTSRDHVALDKIALMLGTADQWSGADMLESIANIVGTVRPHPGNGAASTYVAKFRTARGYDPSDVAGVSDYISDDEGY